MTEVNREAHRPVRYYGECDCRHPDDLDESIPDDIAAEYESAWYDSHVSVEDGYGDSMFMSCELAFDQIACMTCARERDEGDIVEWPCPFADPSTPLPEPLDMPPALPQQQIDLEEAAMTDGT